MSILSKLTKEESFELVEYLASIDITTQNRKPNRYRYDAEHYAPIAIPRLAFLSAEELNKKEARFNPLIAFEEMEQSNEDEAEFHRNHVRYGDMYYFVPEKVQEAKLQEYFDNHHISSEPQQTWQIYCNKIINALENKKLLK